MKVILILLIVGGLATAVGAAPGDARTDPQELIQADLQFGRASATRGLEGWLSYFDDDAVIFPGRGPILKGIASIVAYYRTVGFSPIGLTWKPAGAELAASGDLGYTYGTAEFRGSGPDGKPLIQRGKYTTVWRRRPGGSWKVALDIGNVEPPEPAEKR